MFNNNKNNYIIIDIKDFNKITKFNSYFLSLQSNITFIIMNFLYIFTINNNNYFHQFFMRYKNKYKFIIIFYRE